MPVHNAKCNNKSCESHDEVIEVVVYGCNSDMPDCTKCGAILSKTFALTQKDQREAEHRKRRRTQVRDPFMKPNSVPRRAFDKNANGDDLADDMRTGDIFK